VGAKFTVLGPCGIIVESRTRTGESDARKRAYGMDQDFYPWSAIVTRSVLRWPDNVRVAFAVIVNFEHRDREVAGRDIDGVAQ
jgi:hypothetical protein